MAFDLFEQTTYTRHRLDKTWFAASETVARTGVLELSGRMEQDIFNNLVLQVRGAVWAQSKYDIFHYPNGWWQACKERWFPVWALKRWPVVYTTVTIKSLGKYPSLQIQGEKHRPYIEVVEQCHTVGSALKSPNKQ